MQPLVGSVPAGALARLLPKGVGSRAHPERWPRAPGRAPSETGGTPGLTSTPTTGPMVGGRQARGRQERGGGLAHAGCGSADGAGAAQPPGAPAHTR